jgi:hypothetical protein
VVHPLTDCGNAGPRRKVIGVPLALIQLSQSIIIRIEFTSDLKALAELHREIIIHPCDVNDVLLSEADPIQVAYVIDHLFVSKGF